MLEPLSTTGVLCWFTNASLVRKLHGSVCLILMNKIAPNLHMYINIVESTQKEVFFAIWSFTRCKNMTVAMTRSFLANHKFATSPWRRHQMETFSASLDLFEGNHRSPDQRKHQSSASLASVREIHPFVFNIKFGGVKNIWTDDLHGYSLTLM